MVHFVLLCCIALLPVAMADFDEVDIDRQQQLLQFYRDQMEETFLAEQEDQADQPDGLSAAQRIYIQIRAKKFNIHINS